MFRPVASNFARVSNNYNATPSQGFSNKSIIKTQESYTFIM